MSENRFDWIGFYTELATKLVPYANDRLELVDKIKRIFQKAELNLPTLERDNDVYDIDPFTVFGLFNKGLTFKNRIKIITEFSTEFDVKAKIPTSLDGLPVLNAQKATFYWFGNGRGEHDIDNLWDVFKYAIEYADTDSQNIPDKLIACYDRALKQKGVRWNITMGLFWIRPYKYLNLDSRNREFINELKANEPEFNLKVPGFSNVPDGSTYFRFCDDCAKLLTQGGFPYKNFPEMSSYAWNSTQPDEPASVNALSDDTSNDIRYWMYSVFTDESWQECLDEGIMVIGCDAIGDFTQYDSKESMRLALQETYQGDSSRKNQALMAWSFSRIMKENDIIFAKRGNTLVGRGVVTGEYCFDDSRELYKSCRSVKWMQVGKWEHPGNAVAKRLTDLTSYTEYVKKLNDIYTQEEEDLDEEADAPEITYPPYTADDFLGEVFMSREDYDTLVAVLQNKKNIILQGAPGVGKTFAAKRLAYSVMGEKAKDRVMMIQFHQSYSYEDFIMGFRPSATGFELKKGAFYNFCKAAEEDSDNDYFFIIDEINRGNMSKIFGELFMLIETDKRGIELQLLYSDERFSVPENVYIIGMMNTADRSLAMLDYALRRRFAFIELKPGFETDGFRAYRLGIGNEKFNRLIACVESLNSTIAADDSLGEGFCIGHSYFCNLTPETTTDQALSAIVEFEIIPLLKEYWFDEPTKVRDWSSNLRSAIK